MHTRAFGNTTLHVSPLGFGAWAIGGPAMAGTIPIGWGDADDATSILALKRAHDLGISFYDTADFYGLGHSEELIGRIFGNRDDVIIATKVGHRLDHTRTIVLDYTPEHIRLACVASLKRLRRDTIDFYQLHSARVSHFQETGCLEAMEQLRQEGKIRYWGVSLNTFSPEPEADYLLERGLGHGFQVVLNILNQRSLPVIRRAAATGYGIIARMPLQFGLLTGKFTAQTRFRETDHRSFRLSPEILAASLDALQGVWPVAERLRISRTALSLSFCTSFPGVSTVIPGIRTPAQAEENVSALFELDDRDRRAIEELYPGSLEKVVKRMESS